MLKITNPFTEQEIETLTEDSESSTANKYQSALKKQPAWAALPLSKRLATIKKFNILLQENSKKLAKIQSQETGKPISQALGEIKATKARIDYFLRETKKCSQDEIVHKSKGLQEVISYSPLGVIGNISAWNYPYFVGTNVFIPALLTGNAVLYKPSEHATLTGLQITKFLHRAGVPKEVFSCLIGGGEVGAELLKQPLNGIFFTGSYPTGKKIAEAASSELMRVQLELGGKDPTYVCEDANVASAAESLADGAFYNAGQSCCSVERIYVHQKIYDDFVKHFVKTVRGFKLGDPLKQDTYIGPLARKPQISVLEGQVADALSSGAELHTGGKTAGLETGYFFEPTVFSNVSHEMLVMKEESFGPIIGIQKVKSDNEAISLMNDTEFGLTAGVFSKNQSRARKILSQINSGTVYWNCCDRVSPNLPWSGRGHSGIGSTLSHIGIRAFLQPKGWHLRQL